MGGNAIPKEIKTRRYLADEYHKLIPEVIALTKEVWGVGRVAVIPAYRDKESFGDMDVLLELSDSGLKEFRELICETFGVDFITTDGDHKNQLGAHGSVTRDKVYSIAYKELQLDFILVEPGIAFECAYNYFSWNDLGNLLGRVAHKFGFKFGHDGLRYPFRDGDHMFEEILVSQDWNEILPAFDWDPERFNQGFDTLGEVFDYVTTSKYFNPEIYLLENRNAKSRYRDQKRKTYNEFLDYCQAFKTNLNKYQYPEHKSQLLEPAFEMLRRCGFAEKYMVTYDKYLAYLEFKAKFNGEIVSWISGRKGQDLGALMVGIRQFYNVNEDPEAFRKLIMNMSEKQLSNMVDEIDDMLIEKGELPNLYRSVNVDSSSLQRS